MAGASKRRISSVAQKGMRHNRILISMDRIMINLIRSHFTPKRVFVIAIEERIRTQFHLSSTHYLTNFDFIGLSAFDTTKCSRQLTTKR